MIVVGFMLFNFILKFSVSKSNCLSSEFLSVSILFLGKGAYANFLSLENNVEVSVNCLV